MTGSFTPLRSEDVLVGLFALGVVPWIGWTLLRGLREKRLPLGRIDVRRDERPGVYRVLLAFWLAMALGSAMIMLDLLFGVDVRFWL
jgi:hypothetical protein